MAEVPSSLIFLAQDLPAILVGHIVKVAGVVINETDAGYSQARRVMISGELGAGRPCASGKGLVADSVYYCAVTEIESKTRKSNSDVRLLGQVGGDDAGGRSPVFVAFLRSIKALSFQPPLSPSRGSRTQWPTASPKITPLNFAFTDQSKTEI